MKSINDDDDEDDDDAKIKQLGKALDLSPSPVNEVSTLPPLHPDFFSDPKKVKVDLESNYEEKKS